MSAVWQANCASGVTQQTINLDTNTSTTIVYSGAAKCLVFSKIGNYKFELWGAQGGEGGYPETSTNGGYGAYTAGELNIQSTVLYLYLGQRGINNHSGSRSIAASTWNGGGLGGYDSDNQNAPGGSGGGASDIRTFYNSAWNNADSLRSRIMVAGAGGGGGAHPGNGQNSGTGVHAGGLSNIGSLNRYSGSWTADISQATGYQFGVGQNGWTAGCEGAAGGGSGWYGGTTKGSGSSNCGGPAAGGTSYISGHTGAVAVASTSSSSPVSGCTTGNTNISCSITPYINPSTNAGYTFTNTMMIDGRGYRWTNTQQTNSYYQMPNPNGGNYSNGIGHSGNGYARITYLGD